ncbi:hypothetical protein K8W59_09180 [Nocardioides rotundus]|uniref:hypothetical protein n=1 Tax=Nocardioides rotundus TaxID=1774216 RepID=UPI001CBA8917|nr:hypothetical protein [Nocardioides rotundus]UAL31580.1 hypothetical protein K8W59_09180 [Nocardioides rotundus]
MSAELPDAARLCWWGTAWLQDRVAPDDLLDEVPGTPPLLGQLTAWRRAGCRGLALALPVEGDPLGLGGPPAFNAAALEAGEAVLALGVEGGLVDAHGEGVWQVEEARRGSVPDLPEADRALRRELLRAAESLAELDVARWRPEVADELIDLRRPADLAHPPGVPAAAVGLAARSLRALAIVDLALDDDGAAVSAYEIDRRRDALRGLERAGRGALVAACSPDAWPPGDRF